MLKHIKSQPLVTILMSVYNAEEFLVPAIESILNQTFKNFEFLIIDDGSTDKTLEIIKAYTDDRIRIISNEKNMGLAFSLNLGMKLASGKYVARMDADDISNLRRLEKQVNYLEEHQDIALVGSYAKIIDEKARFKRFLIVPLKHEAIMAKMIFHMGLIHPSVMLRKVFFQDHSLNYDNSLKLPLEDKDLWLRAGKLLKFHNLPSFLIYYRYRSEGESKKIKNMSAKYFFTANLIKKYWNDSINIDNHNLLIKFISGSGCWHIVKPTPKEVKEVIALFYANKFNKYEESYLGYLILQICRIDKEYFIQLSLGDKIKIVSLSLKWIYFSVKIK